jgi:hypothetical protein
VKETLTIPRIGIGQSKSAAIGSKLLRIILCACLVVGGLIFWPLGDFLVSVVRVPNVTWIASSIFIAILSIAAIVSVFWEIPSDSRFAKSRD